MSRLIKQINASVRVDYDAGTFDEWCVYLTHPPAKRYAPRDTEYFSFFKTKAATYGAARIYEDFIKIYEKTTRQLSEDVLNIITKIAAGYGDDALEMDIWLTIIYAGMVAEENKEYAILKKRIKRLGVHQILFDGLPPEKAANFSRGKKWRELDPIMKERGF